MVFDFDVAQGYAGLGGVAPADAAALHARARLGGDAAAFDYLWRLADLDGDGRLNRLEFCLFMAALKAAKRGGAALPCHLSLTQARARPSVPKFLCRS